MLHVLAARALPWRLARHASGGPLSELERLLKDEAFRRGGTQHGQQRRGAAPQGGRPSHVADASDALSFLKNTPSSGTGGAAGAPTQDAPRARPTPQRSHSHYRQPPRHSSGRDRRSYQQQQQQPRSTGPARSCALCGQERERDVMEEMGAGSGFYRCMVGYENIDCAPERKPAHLRAAERARREQDSRWAGGGRAAADDGEPAPEREGPQVTLNGSRAFEELEKRRKRKANQQPSWRSRR